MRFFAIVFFVLFFRIRKEVLPAAFFIGLIFAAAGELTRILAQSTISKDEKLAKTGLYACCRNPLYLGSFMILIGFLCFTITGKFHAEVLIFWLIVLISTFIVYKKEIKNEEKRLSAIFGEEFAEYRNKVPLFIPSPAAIFRSILGLKLNFRQIVSNREHKMLIGLILMLIVISGGIFYY